MAAVASLQVRISAQIAELQKAFDDAFGTVSKFEKQFAGVASSVQQHQEAINKAFASFAGDNITKEANAIAKAIEKIGGVSKLTAAEQKTANATIAEALAKYKALGETAPKSIQSLADSFSNLNKAAEPSPKAAGAFDGILGKVAGVAAGVGVATVAFSAFNTVVDTVENVVSGTFGAIKDAVSHTIELGDSLFTLSQKTGVSVESLSALKFVAGQTNTSLDSISGAVFKLEANLGKGAKETSAALSGIGLSLKDLRQQAPEEAFASILKNIGELPSATERAATGVAIFGKSFKDVAQLSKEDLPALIQQAKDLGLVMSTETAVAADRFNDAMGALRGRIEGLGLQLGAKLLPALIAFAETFGDVFAEAFKSVAFSGEKFSESFDLVVVQVGKGAAKLVEVFALLVDATTKWASDSILRFAAEADAFIALGQAMVGVARLVDQATNGGQGAKAFDAIASGLAKTKAAIDGVAVGVATAGSTVRQFAQAIEAASAGAGDKFAANYARIRGEITASADKMRESLKNVGEGGVAGAKEASDAFSSFGKQLKELTAQIDRAKGNGTPLAELVRLFGDEAAKATPKANAWGIAVAASVDEVSRAFNKAALDKTLTKLDDQFSKFFDARAEAQFKKFQAAMHESAVALAALPALFTKLDDGVIKLGSDLAKKQFDKLSAGMHDSVDAIIVGIHPLRDAFAEFGKSLPDLIFGTLKNGGNLLGAIAAGLAATFAAKFQSALDAAKKAGTKLSGTQNAIGLAGEGLSSFIGGFGIGNATNKTKGVLGGAGAGALAGLPLAGATGGLSVVLGAGIGALGGFFGGRAADKRNAAALEENKIALAQQFGGMQKLNELAQKLGVNIQAAFDAKKPAQFQAAVDKLNAAVEDQNKRLAGLQSALDGVNKRAAAFSDQFSGLVATRGGGDKDASAAAAQKIQELAQRTQPEFERLGLFVRDTFAGIVKESGNAFDALTQLAPAFQTLKSGVTDFGLESTSVIDGLLASFDLVNNDAFKPLFENIQSTGALFKGLFDAKALSPEGFQAAAADIGQSIQEIANRGGDIAKALALSQPQLQALYEAQAKFGGITDQTTQSILEQAKQQGLVGEQFKSVNDKILDVLLAINKVLGGDIPASAQAAATSVETSFGGAVDAATGKITGDFSESFRRLQDPAAAAAKTMQSEFEAKAAAAAASIGTSVGGRLDALGAQAGKAASRISSELAGIKAPDIKIGVDFNFEQPELPPWAKDWALKGGDFSGVPALASGGIVRRPTLALIGEAGPEAVVPLSRLSSGSRPTDDGPSVVFGPGSVVLQGTDAASIKRLVESGEFIDAMKKQLSTNVQGLATSVRRVTA